MPSCRTSILTAYRMNDSCVHIHIEVGESKRTANEERGNFPESIDSPHRHSQGGVNNNTPHRRRESFLVFLLFAVFLQA